MRKVSVGIALILCIAMLAGLLAGCNGDSGAGDEDRVFEMNVNFTVSEASARNIVEWLEGIQEESNGRISFNFYFSNSLMAIPEIPRGLHSGIADISQLPLPNFPSQFPLNTRLLQLPFMGLGDINKATEVFNQIFNEFDELPAELAASGIMMLTANSFSPYHIHLRNPVDIREPADLAGLRLLTQKAEVAQVIANNRGAPVELPPPEFFSTLDRGVADGFVNMFGFLTMFGVYELIDAHIVFGDVGFFTDFTMVVIRLETFNQLPPDLQRLFTDSAPAMQAAEIGHLSGMNAHALQRARDMGSTIVELTPQEIDVWKQAALPVHEATIAELEGLGLTNVRAIYERILELAS